DVTFDMILSVNEYLNRLRDAHRFPRRSAIRPEELGGALGRISILEVVPGSPPDFVFRLYGTYISAADGDEMTNRSVREVQPQQYRDMLERHYREMLEAATPIFHEIEVQARNLRATYQRGLFPLSEDDEVINKILSISGWSSAFDRCWQLYIQHP